LQEYGTTGTVRKYKGDSGYEEGFGIILEKGSMLMSDDIVIPLLGIHSGPSVGSIGNFT
jgi:hypothetical protein